MFGGNQFVICWEFAFKLCFVEGWKKKKKKMKKRLQERVNLMNVLAMLFLLIKKWINP